MDIRYPTGHYVPEKFSDFHKELRIEKIRSFPENLKKVSWDLNDKQLDTPYREGGWTLRQVIHHLADSHMNGYIRCKLAFTEVNAVLKTYEEKVWAETTDAKLLPIGVFRTIAFLVASKVAYLLSKPYTE